MGLPGLHLYPCRSDEGLFSKWHGILLINGCTYPAHRGSIRIKDKEVPLEGAAMIYRLHLKVTFVLD